MSERQQVQGVLHSIARLPFSISQSRLRAYLETLTPSDLAWEFQARLAQSVVLRDKRAPIPRHVPAHFGQPFLLLDCRRARYLLAPCPMPHPAKPPPDCGAAYWFAQGYFGYSPVPLAFLVIRGCCPCHPFQRDLTFASNLVSVGEMWCSTLLSVLATASAAEPSGNRGRRARRE